MRSPSIALVLADGSGAAAPASSSFSFPQYDSGEIPYTLKTAGGVSIDISQPGRALTLRMRLGSTLIGRPAVQTAPGVGYFPIADGDTLAPVVAGPFVVDALYTDNADTLNTPAEVMLISTWTLLNAVAVPTSPITPLPSQNPLAVGPQGPTGATGPQPPLSSATPQPLGTASAGVGTTASRADHVHQLPAITGGTRWFRIKGDFAGVGDGGADDTAAVQRTLDAYATNGGGKIAADGFFRVTTAGLAALALGHIGLSLNPGPAYPAGAYPQIAFEGDGTNSGFVIDAGAAAAVFSFYGAYVNFKGLVFSPFNTADDGTLDVGGSLIALGSCFTSIVEKNVFNGLRVGSAVVSNNDSDVVVRDNVFAGSAADAAGLRGLISSTLYSDMVIEGNRFEEARLDRGRSIGKVAFHSNAPWIYFNTPGSQGAHDKINAVNQGTTIVRKNKFASAYVHPCIVLDAPTQGQSDLLYGNVLISDNNFDQFGDVAVRATNCRYFEMSRNWIGVLQDGAPNVTVELHNCGDVLLKQNNPMFAQGATGTTAISIDAATKSVIAIDNTWDVYQVADPVATPTLVTQGGVTARIRLSQGALVANTLSKPGATVGSVDQLATTDDATLTSGVILDAAGGAGVNVRVAELRGQRVSVKSDGAGTFTPAQRFTSSGASAGRIKSVAAPGGIGLVDGTAAASADALAWVIF